MYSAGGMDEEYIPRSEVLVLDGEDYYGEDYVGEDWREVGELQIARGKHAATMIDTASFMEFCN